MNPDPQIKYYNVCDPPHLTDNTKEGEEDNEEQSDKEHDDDESNYKDPDDASQDQDQGIPPIQPSGMNINISFPVINTIEQFDIFQV
eukprot:2477669-Ditylum_brightwellii.AAC.1